MLRGGVRGPVRARGQAGAGVHEHDGPPRRTQGGQREPGEHGWRDHVDRELVLPGGGRQVGDRTEVDDPGGVDHGVESLRQLSSQGLDLCCVGEVGDEHGRARQLGAQVVGPLGGTSQEHEVIASLEEPVGQHRADSGTRSGHQVRGHQRVNTTLPNTSPFAIAANPSRASVIGSTRSINGLVPVASRKLTSWPSSARVPIVEPTTRSWRKKMRLSSVDSGLGPLVAPLITTIPPGRSERREWFQVAAPTVSITASTRSGRRAPDSKTWCAPISSARARLASSRLVASTCRPPARARLIRAVATPPPAPCTRTVWPGLRPPCTKSIRYAVSQAVGRQAASSKLSDDGFGTTLLRGTATRSAKVPW